MKVYVNLIQPSDQPANHRLDSGPCATPGGMGRVRRPTRSRHISRGKRCPAEVAS
jgi:hypothetical protein